mmetsp:Transcript_6625/g.29941  ORF Transcript_6625/g.29941 Transcript_6625/m.29941 type:complete len:229 (+) Transcript_6625:947-1633(+)
MNLPSGEMAEHSVRLLPPSLALTTCVGAAASFIMPSCPLVESTASFVAPPGPPCRPSPSRHTSTHLEWSHRSRGGSGWPTCGLTSIRSCFPLASDPPFRPFLPADLPGPVHVPGPVSASGVRCGTDTTRTGCLLRNACAGYARSCASLPPVSNTDPAGPDAIAIALTSWVWGRLQTVYAHVLFSSSMRSNCATWESIPEAYTNLPSGEDVTASTSALCCLKVYSLVPN